MVCVQLLLFSVSEQSVRAIQVKGAQHFEIGFSFKSIGNDCDLPALLFKEGPNLERDFLLPFQGIAS